MITSALVIREPWIDLILSGRKTWEMRSKPTKKRGKIGLIRQGTGHVVGTANLIDCRPPLELSTYMSHFYHHRIPDNMLGAVQENGWIFPWVIAEAAALGTPVPYTHKSGAVVFVNLEPDASSAIEAQI